MKKRNSATSGVKRVGRRGFLFGAGAPAAIGLVAAAGTVNATTGSSEKEHFKEFVTRTLTDIDDLTREGGPIQNQIVTINERLTQLSSTIDTCNNAIGDYNDIRAVKQTLDEICKALHLNCPATPNK